MQMREARGVTLQPPQILRLPRKMIWQNVMEMPENRWNIIYYNAWTIRGWSEKEAWNRQSATRLVLSGLATSIFYWKMQHVTPRLSFKNHQVLHLPPKVTLELWTSTGKKTRRKTTITLKGNDMMPDRFSTKVQLHSFPPSLAPDAWNALTACTASSTNMWFNVSFGRRAWQFPWTQLKCHGV